MNNFHESTKKVLKERNISQRKLAAMIGVTPQSLGEWLNTTFPPMERFLQICNALQSTPNDLLGVKERKDCRDNQA